jgi:hypothetical protein
LAIQKNGTATALPEPAAELRSIELQILLKQIKQWSIRIVDIQRNSTAVDR